MKDRIINFNKEEIIKIQNSNNIYDMLNINNDLTKILNTLIKTNHQIEVDANNALYKHIKSSLKHQKELDVFYDLTLYYHTDIAGYMIKKIKKEVYRICDTNSKNILIGDHKEKWGGIVGHITGNRKDKVVKIIKFVKNLRKQFPYITSSYTCSTIGFNLDNYILKGLNDYIKCIIPKHRFIPKNKPYKINKHNKKVKSKFFRKKSKIEIYKENLLNKRKNIIKTKYRYTYRNNLN